MQLVIIGHRGQLGWELSRLGATEGFETIGFDLPEIDITDPNNIQKHLKGIEKAIVINAAAYTAVDKAEKDQENAFAVNATGPGLLAFTCKEKKFPLIHISTDYVFNGEKKIDYTEADPVSPLGVYGQSKADGESAVRNTLPNHLIVRTAWLFGVHGQNFVKTMLRLGKENEKLRVVCDQVGCPTDAMDLASVILQACRMMKEGKTVPWGTYHYCGAGHTSWHGFAEAVFKLSRDLFPLKVRHVDPITTQEYPTAARRPNRSVLDCSKIEAAFGITRRFWGDSLKDMLLRLKASKGTD